MTDTNTVHGEAVAWLVEAKRHDAGPHRELVFHNQGGAAAHARVKAWRGTPGVYQATRTALYAHPTPQTDTDAELSGETPIGEAALYRDLKNGPRPLLAGRSTDTDAREKVVEAPANALEGTPLEWLDVVWGWVPEDTKRYVQQFDPYGRIKAALKTGDA